MRPATRLHLDHTGRDPRTKIIREKVLRDSPCGKQAYTSKKLAKHHAAVQSKLHGEHLHAYHCTRGCHAWHIGHPIGSRAMAS